MNHEEQLTLTKKQRKELRRQEKRAWEERLRRASQFKKIAIWLTVVVVIIGLAWLIFYFSKKGAETIPPDDDPFIGSSQAQLVITEFSDFQCPACRQAVSLVKQAEKEYGDKIKIIFNNFPLPSHRWATKAAIASECAYSQGKFWEYHDLLFDNGASWLSADDPINDFKDYAKKLGMNEEKFSSCLDSKEAKDKVNYDVKEAKAKNIIVTPTFFINDKRVEGAPTFDEFKSIIDDALKKSS